MNIHTRDKGWDDFSIHEKLEGMRNDIIALYDIVETLTHQDHVVADAFRLVHSRLDGLTTSQRVTTVKKNQSVLTD